jgi:hypothetical protein
MPIAAAVVAPVFSWTGFYVGADVGYWTSSTNLLLPALALSNGSPKPNGIALGGHLGYRYQFANNFVLGAEADLAWLGNKTAYAALAGFAPASWALRATWNSSIRATAGISVDRALFYVTGGVSFLGINGCGVDNPAVSTACRNGTQFSGTRTGWTLGGRRLCRNDQRVSPRRVPVRQLRDALVRHPRICGRHHVGQGRDSHRPTWSELHVHYRPIGSCRPLLSRASIEFELVHCVRERAAREKLAKG